MHIGIKIKVIARNSLLEEKCEEFAFVIKETVQLGFEERPFSYIMIFSFLSLPTSTNEIFLLEVLQHNSSYLANNLLYSVKDILKDYLQHTGIKIKEFARKSVLVEKYEEKFLLAFMIEGTVQMGGEEHSFSYKMIVSFANLPRSMNDIFLLEFYQHQTYFYSSNFLHSEKEILKDNEKLPKASH